MNSAGRALARWDEIRARQPALLGDRALVIAPDTWRDQPVWAVRTGPFASARDAMGFCQKLLAVGQDCWAMVTTSDAAPPEATRAEAPRAAGAPARHSEARGGVYAQLAASDTSEAVSREWLRLRQHLGVLLRDRPEVTVAAEGAGRTVWRLRTGPFQQPREAEAFCAEVRAAGGGCWAAAGS